MAINYEVFEAAGALQYIDEETRTWSTDDFVAAMEAIRPPSTTAPSLWPPPASSTAAPRAAIRAPALW